MPLFRFRMRAEPVAASSMKGRRSRADMRFHSRRPKYLIFSSIVMSLRAGRFMASSRKRCLCCFRYLSQPLSSSLPLGAGMGAAGCVLLLLPLLLLAGCVPSHDDLMKSSSNHSGKVSMSAIALLSAGVHRAAKDLASIMTACSTTPLADGRAKAR